MGEMVTGPFRFGSWAYNETVKPIAFDLEKAKSLLDEAGWKDTDGDGVRDRNGKPFKFEVICGDTIMSPNGRTEPETETFRQSAWIWISVRWNGERFRKG